MLDKIFKREVFLLYTKVEECKDYISNIMEKFNLDRIKTILDRLKPLNVLIIGDTIIDEYTFVQPKGRAIKDPILSVEYKYHETYAGGALAIANHVSSFVDKVKLITLVGDKDSRLDFINKVMEKNIDLKAFTKKDTHTIVKKRYIDAYRNNKLFKVEYMDDKPVTDDLSKEIVTFLSEELPKYDLVMVGDFGHGFINESIREILVEKSRFLSANVQSNSANMGYNYISHYKKSDFMIMNEEELRLPLMRRFGNIESVVKEFHTTFNHKKFLVTLGKHGCIFFNDGNIYRSPIFTSKVVDTVGAGDAVFALTSLIVYKDKDSHLIPFIANCAGGVKSEYMGNKESVTKEKLLSFIKEIYENEEKDGGLDR